MIDQLVKEVEISLKNGCYMSALMVALTLPDICSKLCEAAMCYYNGHKEEFNFFNYNIVDCDFHTGKMFKRTREEFINGYKRKTF